MNHFSIETNVIDCQIYNISSFERKRFESKTKSILIVFYYTC